MSKKGREIILIFAITIIAAIWFYRAIKGSLVYESVSEFVIVLIIAVVVATIISGIYLKRK